MASPCPFLYSSGSLENRSSLGFFLDKVSSKENFRNFYEFYELTWKSDHKLKDVLSFLTSTIKVLAKGFPILRGGGKKHKKKVYTKPKKKKHIHKKTKLRILEYFRISGGKIEQIRRSSPEAPGCFMAEHFNRVTCGKTGLTFVRKS